MPRPTAAQLAYGSATVVFSTVAMLLLSRTTTGVGIAIIGVAALLLGLLVAMTVPVPGSTKAAHPARTAPAHAAAPPAPSASGKGPEGRVPTARAHAAAGADTRMSEHSLRR